MMMRSTTWNRPTASAANGADDDRAVELVDAELVADQPHQPGDRLGAACAPARGSRRRRRRRRCRCRPRASSRGQRHEAHSMPCDISISRADRRLQPGAEQVPVGVAEQPARQTRGSRPRPRADREDDERPDHQGRRLVDVVLGLLVGARTAPDEHQEVQARHVERGARAPRPAASRPTTGPTHDSAIRRRPRSRTRPRRWRPWRRSPRRRARRRWRASRPGTRRGSRAVSLRRPPILVMSPEPLMACMTEPAQRNRPALKKACVNRWKTPRAEVGGADADEHEPELADRGVGQDLLEVVLREPDDRREQGGQPRRPARRSPAPPGPARRRACMRATM